MELENTYMEFKNNKDSISLSYNLHHGEIIFLIDFKSECINIQFPESNYWVEIYYNDNKKNSKLDSLILEKYKKELMYMIALLVKNLENENNYNVLMCLDKLNLLLKIL